MIRQDYTDNTLDPSTTGQTQLGPVNIHRFGGTVEAKIVTALAGAADLSWNVNLDGNAIFSATQVFSSAGIWEQFHPDQNRYASGSDVPMEFDVTSATSGAAISTLFASVLLETDADED